MKLDFLVLFHRLKNGKKKEFQFRFLTEMSRTESATFDEI